MIEEETFKASRTTITIDSKISNEVIPALDEENFMQLGKSSCTRADLLLYAMAIGWDSKLPIPIEQPLSGGFARTESFSSKVSMLIDVLHFSDAGFDNPDELRNRNAAYALAEKYANGGFHLIKGDLHDHISSEEKANMIIAELTERHMELFGKPNTDYDYEVGPL